MGGAALSTDNVPTLDIVPAPTAPSGKAVLIDHPDLGRHRPIRTRADRLERQREGVVKAKAEGKYKGRAPTARAKHR